MKRSARLAVIDEALLDDIRIATPCTADWNEMHGDDRVRHCGECRLNVYDVSQMTRKEAATLIALHEGQRVCLRLYRRPDGTLLTQDCWQRLAAARRRGWVAFAAALVLVAATQLGLRFAALGWLLRLSGERTPPTVTAPLPAPTPPSVAPPAPLVEPTPEVQPEHEPKLMGKIALPPPPPKPSKPGKRSPKAPPPPEEFVIGDYSQLWRFPTGGKWAIPDRRFPTGDSRPAIPDRRFPTARFPRFPTGGKWTGRFPTGGKCGPRFPTGGRDSRPGVNAGGRFPTGGKCGPRFPTGGRGRFPTGGKCGDSRGDSRRFPTGGKWAIPDPGGKWRDSRPGVNEHATQRLGRR